MDSSLLMVIHPSFYRVGDDTDNDAIEHKRTKQENKTTGHQHPTMYMSVITTHIEIVQRVGICQQIQRQQILVKMLGLAKFLPLCS